MKILVKSHKKKLTLQDAFSIAYKWAQKHPQCRTKMGWCAYRDHDNTNACLIGALIPDEQIHDDLNGKVSENWEELKRLFVPDINEEILDELQSCHDNADKAANDYRTGVNKLLKEFATKYNLVMPSKI